MKDNPLIAIITNPELTDAQKAFVANHEFTHLSHRMVIERAEHKMFLKETLAPLLQDAFDAIEIDHPEIALGRIARALRLISEHQIGK